MTDATQAHEFVMKEYENSAQLTFHIDEMRNKLTGFFLTFAGVGVAAVGFLLKENPTFDLGFSLLNLVAGLFAMLGLLGVCAILVLGRLRGVQIEHFRIINNIRTRYTKGDTTGLAATLELSAATLPKPNRKSGSYFWLAMILLVTSALFGSGLYLTLARILRWMPVGCAAATQWGRAAPCVSWFG